MSNKSGLSDLQNQINYLQQQIDDIETGVIAIDYTNENYISKSSNIIDPKTGLYNGTQGLLTTNNIENLAITNAKIANGTIESNKINSIDGSKIVDGTITSDKISNGTITNIDIAGNANIEQSKIIGLIDINTDVNTLKNYFLNSRLKLSNLEKSNNNY